MQKNIIKAALFTKLRGGRWGLPILWEGEPGIAKTAFLRLLAHMFGLPLEVLSPGERGEGAFGVVPVPAEAEDGAMVLAYPRPEWTSKFAAPDSRGLIFVDELTSAPPALHPPLLGLLLDGRVGGWEAPKGVRRMAACNPVELAAGGYDLPAPVANRVGHLAWTPPTVAQHTAYMLRGDDDFDLDEESEDEDEIEGALDPAAEEKRVTAAWGPAYARAAGIEGAFLNRMVGYKNKCPKAGDPKASKAWPSDRTWEMATRAWASSIVHGLTPSETEMFVGAFIGQGIASELFTFAAKQDLPDPIELLDGKIDFSHDPKRLDRTIAVLNSCSATVTPKSCEKRKQRSDAFWKLIEKLSSEKKDLDIYVPAVDALIASDLHVTPAAGAMLTRLNATLRAAGITPNKRRP